MKKLHDGLLPALTLFGSLGTLLCCALPALLVSLGAGAAVIGLVSTFPQLIWLSEHKVGLFIFAGLMLVISGTGRYLTRNAPCPVDPKEAVACKKLRRISFSIFLFSLIVYSTGFFFAFVAQYFIK
jgi:hypothetical protein